MVENSQKHEHLFAQALNMIDETLCAGRMNDETLLLREWVPLQ